MAHSEEDIVSLPAIENYPSSRAQTLIDQEILEMTESIRALKTRRNEISPVSKLPPELLCKIFELVQQSGPGGSMFHRLSDLFRWTKITHVSRRWMEIAKGDTSLWTNITITGRWPEWEQEVLVRSQNSPISLWVPTGTMQLDYWKKLVVAERALTQLHRVTRLTIEGLYPYDLHRILSSPNLPHPTLLRSLKLTTSFRESNGSLPSKTSKVFDEIFPSASGLVSLSLSGYGVEWNPLFFSNLRRLKIVNTPMSFRPSVSAVLSALSSAQKLESLILVNFLVKSDEPQPQVVHLPRLYRLHLTETATAASGFIPLLTFRDDVNICVECNTEVVSQSQFNTLLRIFDRSGTQRIRHLSLADSALSQDIHAWEESQENNTESSVGISHFLRPPDISLSLDQQLGLHGVGNPILQACRIMPLQYLESLNLDANLSIQSEEWVEVFGPLRQLKWMTLGTGAAMALFHAILSYDQTIIPSLQHLYIKLTLLGPSPISEMRQALLKRQEQGIRITNLILFDSSHLSVEDISGLKEVVTCVKQSPWGQYPDLDLQT